MPDDKSGSLGVFGTEIGSSRLGVDLWGQTARQDEIPEMRGDRAVKNYREMRLNDPMIGAVVLAVKMIVRSVPWAAEPPEGAEEGDPEVERSVEYLGSAMRDMDQAWPEMIDDSLEAWVYGFEAMETTYKQRLGPQPPDGDIPTSQFSDGLVGWWKIAHRDQAGVVRWLVDPHGKIEGMFHKVEGQDEVFIPIGKMLLFRPLRHGNDPEGISPLRPAYRPYRYKRNHEWMEAVSTERLGGGLPVVEMPMGANTSEGSQDVQRAKDLVQAVRSDSYAGVVLPPAIGKEENHKWKFDLISTGVLIDFDAPIRRYGGEMTTAMLAQFVNLIMQQRGAYALSRDQRDLWHLSMAGLLMTWTQVIHEQATVPLYKLNIGSFPDRTKWARIVPGDIAQHDIEKVVKYIDGLVGAGALDVSDDDRNRLRGLIGWPGETNEQRDRMEEKRNMPPPLTMPRPADLESLSEVERIVGKPAHEWSGEDAWVAAMGMEENE